MALLWSNGTAVEFFIAGFAVELANGIPADHGLAAGLFGVAFFAVAAVYKHFHAVDKGLFAFGRTHGADEGDIGSGELDSEQEDEEGVEIGHDFMPR